MPSQKDYLITGIRLMMSDCGFTIEEIRQKSKRWRRRSIAELQDLWKRWANYKQCVTEKDWYARMGEEQEEGIADYS